MKNKKGFTLIELLAIIVILAIIAVITVPIVLNIIDNSKKGSVQDSALGYKDAVQKYYMNSLVDNTNVELPSGVFLVSTLPSDFEVSGEKPTNDSWVQLVKGQVVAYSLKFGDYTVTKYKDSEVVCEKGSVQENEYIKNIVGTLAADGAKYLSTAMEVYYNPISGEKNCNGQDGCMHWYLYSVKGVYANMILDHNITDALSDDGKWVQESNYNASDGASAGITYPDGVAIPTWGTQSWQSVIARGPVTALITLKSFTSEWIKTRTPMVPNNTNVNEYIVPFDMNENKYQINYRDYHARLITKEETDYLGCTGQTNSCPMWIRKGTLAENATTYSEIYGFWTSSPHPNIFGEVWLMDRSRSYGYNYPFSQYYGVRPVITVFLADVL